MTTGHSNESLLPLLRPRSVAMVGAARRRGTIGGEIFHNLLTSGFRGAVYPVNRTAPAVQGVRAYASVSEIPDEVDLAVIAVPAADVLGAVDDCARKGVRALVVISAGFGEVGPAGVARQEELVRRVRAAGMRLVGPNCLGIINRDPAIGLNATFAPIWPPSGGVAIASQSGALGQAILEYANDLGIGISQFVAMGNKADLSGNDLIAFWAEDPATRVVLLYLESIGNPRRFMQLARRVSRDKPIAIVKAGRTEAGARAARSHTGSLAGSDAAADALLSQAGVLRTDTIEELFDLAMLLDSQPVPGGRRVAVLTNAGGPGIMASDACESRGLVLPRLAPATEAALMAILPPEASVRNPVDMIASASAESYRIALGLLLADPSVDAAIVLFVPPLVTEAVAVAEAIRDAARGAHKPVLTCFMGKHGIPSAMPALREGRLPSYAFPESAAIALAHAVRHGEWRRRPEGHDASLPAAAIEAARAIVGATAAAATDSASGPDLHDDHGERWLRPDETRALLGAIGIRTPAEAFAPDADSAIRAARTIGFPVALKLASDSISHKSDVGGVVLGLDGDEAVRGAFHAIADRLASIGQASAMRGVTVQAMVPRGVEAFAGMTRDPAYGPLIGFGLGGTLVELLRDVVFRVCPLTDVDAREMLDAIRGARALDGFRGAPAADREALADALLRLAALCEALPEIVEMDLNPLVALAPGQGAIAVDARVRVRRPVG